MNKKTVIAIVAIIFVIGCSFIISMKDSNKNINAPPVKVSSKNLPVKVEDIEIEVKKIKNEKDEILLYLRAKNKSKLDISYLGVGVSDGNKLDTWVEYLRKIKSGGKTDNYDSIKNSTDDRTKIPVKSIDGGALHDVNDIKIKKIAYVFKDKGNRKIAEYDVDSGEYTLSDY
jgi:lipoprotein